MQIAAVHHQGPPPGTIRFPCKYTLELVDIVSHKSYYASMRITLSIPEAVAKRFQAAIPARQRSRLVTRLIEQELARYDDTIATACRAANRDEALQNEIDEWQSFDDDIQE